MNSTTYEDTGSLELQRSTFLIIRVRYNKCFCSLYFNNLKKGSKKIGRPPSNSFCVIVENFNVLRSVPKQKPSSAVFFKLQREKNCREKFAFPLQYILISLQVAIPETFQANSFYFILKISYNFQNQNNDTENSLYSGTLWIIAEKLRNFQFP